MPTWTQPLDQGLVADLHLLPEKLPSPRGRRRNWRRGVRRRRTKGLRAAQRRRCARRRGRRSDLASGRRLRGCRRGGDEIRERQRLLWPLPTG
ncbi:hypothetical protein BRADI_4g42081v3 [Brachypodium distachyon]|uniref:Uncharacterized protein n=1 Tax=Brachypodium distachyon TaxID=15368 RepID=A0A2K2CTR2_BRADI|nr:hypothetical protein BRADI_4g42081v3 [Brachypodium distachyon]